MVSKVLIHAYMILRYLSIHPPDITYLPEAVTRAGLYLTRSQYNTNARLHTHCLLQYRIINTASG